MESQSLLICSVFSPTLGLMAAWFSPKQKCKYAWATLSHTFFLCLCMCVHPDHHCDDQQHPVCALPAAKEPESVLLVISMIMWGRVTCGSQNCFESHIFVDGRSTNGATAVQTSFSERYCNTFFTHIWNSCVYVCIWFAGVYINGHIRRWSQELGWSLSLNGSSGMSRVFWSSNHKHGSSLALPGRCSCSSIKKAVFSVIATVYCLLMLTNPNF